MNIILLHPAKCNTWLIMNGDHSVLVDAGYSGKITDFEHLLVENGLKPRDIKLIIMTHTHFDHACGLKALKELTGAKVIVNENEAGFLSNGFCPLPKGTRWYSGFISWLGRHVIYGIGRYAPVKPDITLKVKLDINRYGIDGYILPTRGHTVGSQSLIMGEHAFVGDDMFGIFRNTVFPPFADDVPALMKSWQELLDTGCEKFYPGHGEVIDRAKIMNSLNRRMRR